MRDDFAVFILTHGRANNMHTYKALQKAGYTGKVIFVLDDVSGTNTIECSFILYAELTLK